MALGTSGLGGGALLCVARPPSRVPGLPVLLPVGLLAGPAHGPSRLLDDGVRRGHLVASVAPAILPCTVDPVVLGSSQHHEMVGVPARLLATSMVDVHPLGDGSDQSLIGGDVCGDVSAATFEADAPVVVPVAMVSMDDGPLEQPAPVLLKGPMPESVDDGSADDPLNVRGASVPPPPCVVRGTHLSSPDRAVATFYAAHTHGKGA